MSTQADTSYTFQEREDRRARNMRIANTEHDVEICRRCRKYREVDENAVCRNCQGGRT